MIMPKRAFLTKGVGRHKERLTAFERALRDAGIAQFNLVTVSSIFPPNCKLIPKNEGVKLLHAGQILHVVMSRAETDEPHRHIAASVGVAIPKDRDMYGYLSEHHSYGQTDEQAGDYAEDLAAEMLATIIGVEFDADKSWDQRKEIWRLSDAIVSTRNVSQSARGAKDAIWTSVVAACVLIDA
jgi:arginine decarboxylase